MGTPDLWGDTPLHLAARFEVPLAVVEILMDHGADIQRVNNEGKTALDVAEEARKREGGYYNKNNSVLNLSYLRRHEAHAELKQTLTDLREDIRSSEKRIRDLANELEQEKDELKRKRHRLDEIAATEDTGQTMNKSEMVQCRDEVDTWLNSRHVAHHNSQLHRVNLDTQGDPGSDTEKQLRLSLHELRKAGNIAVHSKDLGLHYSAQSFENLMRLNNGTPVTDDRGQHQTDDAADPDNEDAQDWYINGVTGQAKRILSSIFRLDRLTDQSKADDMLSRIFPDTWRLAQVLRAHVDDDQSGPDAAQANQVLADALDMHHTSYLFP